MIGFILGSCGCIGTARVSQARFRDCKVQTVRFYLVRQAVTDAVE